MNEKESQGKYEKVAALAYEVRQHFPKRRIMFDQETKPLVANFSQTIDVDLDLVGDDGKSLPNMPGYVIRSESEAISYTRNLIKKGIRSVTYRLGGGLRAEDCRDSYVYAPLLINNSGSETVLESSDALIRRHSEFYKALRYEFPRGSLFIIADSFGLAPNLSDGAWGVRDLNGNLDLMATSSFIARIAVEYARADADAVLNIGRVEGEVGISRNAIREAGLNVDLYAFSQNNESKAAYVYLENIISDSYQKILPGNITEMKVRTILDVAEGASAIIVKPADNFHVIQFTMDFLDSPKVALSFLIGTLETSFYFHRPDIRDRVERLVANWSEFESNAKNVRVGTYTVSGSYYIDKLIEHEKGEGFRLNVQDERFRNILSIINGREAFVIDRCAEWYLERMPPG